MALGLLGSYISSSSEDEDDDSKANISLEAIEKPKSAPLLANPFGSGTSVSKAKPSYALDVFVSATVFLPLSQSHTKLQFTELSNFGIIIG